MLADTDRVPSQQPSVVPPDLAAVKKRQQATWASGDFSVVAARIVLQAELLCEAVNLQADWRVLDVATGSGNAAIAAARRGCRVVGTDYVPALLESGRIRAKAEHLEVEFVEGDAENLPFPSASFDAVLSIYGAMFAPDHRKTAAELVRVCRAGWRHRSGLLDAGGVHRRDVPSVQQVHPARRRARAAHPLGRRSSPQGDLR